MFSRTSLRILHRHSQVRLCSTNNKNEYDIVVVGGGIVGVASAREVSLRHPGLKMAILEKESRLAAHQTGHNSGVVHAGIYYKPGSLKAKLCVQGLKLSYKYFEEKGVPYKKVGKLIVATDQAQLDRLAELHDRGIKNDVPDLQLIDGAGIEKIEPFCRGIKALWSPQTGIVDWALVTEFYGKDFVQGGGKIYLDFEANRFEESTNPEFPVKITSKSGSSVLAKYVLTCGGLQSDKLAELSGCSPNPRIIPFRGEYLLLKPEKANMIKGNIYPVPDPRLPFLGVHFTPRMDGSVLLGPNAVLAFSREGYKWSDINIPELVDTLKFPGFRKLAVKYVGAGLKEMAYSAFPRLQVKELRKFVPSLSAGDVSGGPAGVRAQAMDVEGNLLEDFQFDMGGGSVGKRVLHCRNAPSPGATSSLAIALMMADKIDEEFLRK